MEEEKKDLFQSINDQLRRAQKVPQIGHIVRTIQRFNDRDGRLYSGAITYFSVLALVPIMMFSFSLVGMVLDVFRPDLLDSFVKWLQNAFSTYARASGIIELILGFVEGWQTVGIVGLITGLFVGTGWVNNVRSSLVAMSQVDYVKKDEKNFFVRRLLDIPVLAAVLFLLALVFLAPAIANWLLPEFLHLLHLDVAPGASVLIWIGTTALSLLAAICFFLFIFGVFPGVKFNRRAYFTGSVAAGFVITVLQTLAPLLVSIFSGNRGVQLFGAVIVVMLLLNVLALVMLYVCAWIATTDQPAVARAWTDADQPLLNRDDVITAHDHWERAKEDLRNKPEKNLDDDLKSLIEVEPETDEELQELVEEEKKKNRSTFWAGILAGIGLSALLDSILKRNL